MADRVIVLVGEVDRAERCARDAADLADQAARLLEGISATVAEEAARLLEGISATVAEEAARVGDRAEEVADQVLALRGRLEEVRGS